MSALHYPKSLVFILKCEINFLQKYQKNVEIADPTTSILKWHINFIDWFSLEPVISWWKQWMNLSNAVSSNYPKLLSVTAGLSALSFLSLEWFSRQKSTVISMFLQTKGGVDREELLGLFQTIELVIYLNLQLCRSTH